MQYLLHDIAPSEQPDSHRYSCSSASGTGDHYFDDVSSSDPWSTTYTSDSSGSATVNLTMPGFTMRGAIPVESRTLVVHTTTARAGCGLVLTESALAGADYAPTPSPVAPSADVSSSTSSPRALSPRASPAVLIGVARHPSPSDPRRIPVKPRLVRFRGQLYTSQLSRVQKCYEFGRVNPPNE